MADRTENRSNAPADGRPEPGGDPEAGRGVREPVRMICNPASGGWDYGPEDLHDRLGDLRPEIVVTEGPGDAREAAREWEKGLLIVSGGDGTVNEAVNGLGKAGFPEDVTLALMPMGTGNDLAETLKVPANPDQSAEVVRRGAVRRLDVARIRSTGVGEHFFINVATGGAGMEISEAAGDPELKRRWGRLAYLRASLDALGDHAAREVCITLDGEERRLRAVNVTVGNCRYAGGGWPAAPRANPEDGLLDLVVIEDGRLAEIMSLAPKALLRSDYLDEEGVFFARARSLRVEAEPGLGFTADGELIGEEPAEFTVLPRALKVVVGPGYTPEPPETG
jgi:diacylglycerol kinase (ATP)